MIKIGVQTLANKKFSLEVALTDTVAAVKQKIESELSLGAAEDQKLIHLGKILKDEQTVADTKIKANEMIVCMISKKKTAAPAAAAATADAAMATETAPAAATSTSTAPAAAPAATAATPAAATTTTATAAAPAAAASTSSASSDSALVSGNAESETVANLMALGFERAQVAQALRAAFNNPDRAAEYLFNGIPAGLSQPAPISRAPAASSAAPAAAAAAAPAAAAAAAPQFDLASLNIPAEEIAQIRQLLLSQPQLLPMLLQQLAQTNPALVAAIQANPTAFMTMLVNSGGSGNSNTAAAAAAAAAAGGAGGAREHTVQVTDEEASAIMRLEALGFDRNRALEAFLICDRQEEAAANYLLEHQFDDEDGGDDMGAAAGAGGDGDHLDHMDEEGDDDYEPHSGMPE